MNRFEVIGNLGADAEVKTENGKKFVSIRIADTRVRTKGDGTKVEETTWISATINGDGGNLLPYLVKGAKVSAIGEIVVHTYHSEKQRALVAGIKLFIRDISLISTNVDEVPRDLYDCDGVAHRVSKYYYCDTKKEATMYSRSGDEFISDANGWVTKITKSEQTNEQAPVNDEQG